jgi:hypothetical protein
MEENKTNKKRKIFSVIFIVLALILVFIGIGKEEYKKFYEKARNICTQCVGIG